MFQSVLERQATAAAAAVRDLVGGLDPDDIPAREAVRIFDELDRIVRSASAGRMLLARRVEDSMEWKRLGYGSAAEHLAAKSGKGLGAAKSDLETSNALRDLGATRRQMLEGTVSPEQGTVIADAARHNPGAEADLLGKAKTANLQELREEALKAKTAADADPATTHARIRRNRRLVRFTDAEGARHLNLRGPVDEMAIVEAEIDRQLSQLIRTTTPGEPLEGRDARAFDAAVAMARRSEAADEAPAEPGKAKATRPQHLALLRLDIEALWRGYVERDELCEITGLGPIPVEVARRLLGDAVLKLILTRGEAVAHVTSLTRGPTQAMRYALLWTSPTCVVEGCTRTIVEHDHIWGAEYKDTKHTRLDELERACHVHHDLHTLHDWALLPGDGKRPLVPPEDPRHPRHALAPPGARPRGPEPTHRHSPRLRQPVHQRRARRRRALLHRRRAHTARPTCSATPQPDPADAMLTTGSTQGESSSTTERPRLPTGSQPLARCTPPAGLIDHPRLIHLNGAPRDRGVLAGSPPCSLPLQRS